MSGTRNYAWPSQETVARRAQLSVRQLRRVIERLRAGGWVYTMSRRNEKVGKRWRQTVYFATVPERLALVVKEAPWKADPDWRPDPPNPDQTGNGADAQMSGARSNREDIQMSAPTTSAPDPMRQDRTFPARGADIPPPMVRTFPREVRTSECPTNSSSELLDQNNQAQRALSSTAHVKTEGDRQEKPKTKPARSKPDLHDPVWLGKTLAMGIDAEKISGITGQPIEEVRRVIDQAGVTP